MRESCGQIDSVPVGIFILLGGGSALLFKSFASLRTSVTSPNASTLCQSSHGNETPAARSAVTAAVRCGPLVHHGEFVLGVARRSHGKSRAGLASCRRAAVAQGGTRCASRRWRGAEHQAPGDHS
jgi:hypothetical protein